MYRGIKWQPYFDNPVTSSLCILSLSSFVTGVLGADDNGMPHLGLINVERLVSHLYPLNSFMEVAFICGGTPWHRGGGECSPDC